MWKVGMASDFHLVSTLEDRLHKFEMSTVGCGVGRGFKLWEQNKSLVLIVFQKPY